MKNSIIFLLFICLMANMSLMAQNNFKEALSQEIKRGMEGLKIEKMLSPSFISYSISDAKTLHIGASLGALVVSNEKPIRLFESRVLVGENGRTNENFLDENNMWAWTRLSNEVPFSSNNDDLRRSLWLMTDNNYKDAITNYEAKISALNQQSLSDEEKQLIDFSKTNVIDKNIASTPLVFNKSKLEVLTKNLSSVFKNYSKIQHSEVNLFIYDAQVTFANSEGTTVQYPIQIVAVKVIASTQNNLGELIHDHALWFFNKLSDLPDEKTMILDVEKVAKNLSNKSGLKAIEEPYCGPVLFEGQAAAEVFAQKFFGNVTGLLAIRKPNISSSEILSMAPDKVKENSLELMMGKKVISRDFTIEALPGLKQFENKSLIGSYDVDAEGVIPSEKITLIENGVLKNLICGRIPTLRVKESNAHTRPYISNGGIKSLIGPSVIKLSNSNPLTSVDKVKIKQMLLDAAKEEDLEYAYIVRKVVSDAADIIEDNGVVFWGSSKTKPDLSKTIEVYKVYVKDGREELVSMAEVQGLSIKSFKRILATSSQMQVYNTMTLPINNDIYSWKYKLKGSPVSYILPECILFQELDIVKEKQSVVKSNPVVENPLTQVK